MGGQDAVLLDRALALARAGRARSVDALRTLVRIPSLTGEERQGQDYVAKLLRDADAETEFLTIDLAALFQSFPSIAQYPTHWQHDLILAYEDLPTYEALTASGLATVLNYEHRPNVVGRWPGIGSGRSLILNGHIDTVTIEPQAAWRRDPFGADIEDGYLFGRGTSDMKGGLVAALMAMTCLKEAGVTLAGDVILQSVVNEEHSGNGTLDLVRRGITADAAVVLEPTNNQVMVSHPGGLYWQVKVPGIPRSPGARWQGRTQEGISAIEKLPRIIDALLRLEQEYNSRTITRINAEEAPSPFALVIGKVFGGYYETVTAAETIVRGGAYFAPQLADLHEIMQRFRESLAEVNAADDFLRGHPAKLEFLHHDDATLQEPEIAVATTMRKNLARHNRPAQALTGPFACDMRHLVNQSGIPSIIFGPGSIAQAHKPDESIAVQEYLDCIDYLIEFIWNWCNIDTDKGAIAGVGD